MYAELIRRGLTLGRRRTRHTNISRLSNVPMSKSTDDLIRDLEAGGVLGSSPAGLPAPTRPQAPTASRPTRTGSGVLLLLIAVLLIAVVSALPFGSYALYPFALFVTLVHETSHAVMAVATGGAVKSIRINPDLSGVTFTGGGIGPLIASAGYLGATLAGVAVLLTPLRLARWALAALAAVPLAALIAFHPASMFTAAWSIAFAAALALAAWKAPARLAAFLQIFLGVAMGLNAARDLLTLIFISGHDAHIYSDAKLMSNLLFLPPLFWAGLWGILSLILLVTALLKVVRRDIAAL